MLGRATSTGPVLAALLLAACAAPRPPIVEVRPAPTPSPAPSPAPVRPSMADDEIVALVNGRPLTSREVTDRAMAADGRSLIDQYIRWKLRSDRVASLGIVNSEEELKARARVILDGFRLGEGEEAYKRQLADAGMTEEEYIRRFSATPEFSDRLAIEKAFAYDLIVEGSAVFDAMAFKTEEEAQSFLRLVQAGANFDDAATVTEQRSRAAARWPRYRVSRTLTIEALQKSDWIVKTLFGMKPGEVSGIEQAASGFHLVLRCVSVEPPAPGSYDRHRGRATEEALLGRATDDQLRAWVDLLVRGCKIEYKERFLPRK